MNTRSAAQLGRLIAWRRGRVVRVVVLSTILGLATTAALVLALSLLRNPPNNVPTVSRTFIADDRAWTIVESHQFGSVRTWWSQLTRSSMTEPSRKPPLSRLAEALGMPPRENEDPRSLLADYHAQYDDLIKSRGGRVLREPAGWGQFALNEPLPAATEIGCDVGYGWPRICAWYQVTGRSRGNVATTQRVRFGHVVRGTPASRGDLDCRVIPLAVAWTALATNSTVLAAMWLIVLLAPPAVRASIRRSRGRCAGCGYDLSATPRGSPCPECGTMHSGRPA